MVTAALIFFAVFAQAGNPIVTPPQLAPSNTTVNVTNNFQAPDPAVIADAEGRAGPIILGGTFRSLDTNASHELAGIFQLGLGLARIRSDLIEIPGMQVLHDNLNRIVTLSLGLVVASLGLWGLIGRFFGSDSFEAFEALGRVPLWIVVAHASWQWYATMLDFFAAIGALIAASAGGAFGTTLRTDFWSNLGLGVFALFVGLFYLFGLLFFALQIFGNTAFLAFCAVVAPVFIFMKTTPWTNHWGNNWFRMVPATAGDLLAMLTLMAIGATGLEHVTQATAMATIALDLGLLVALPLIRRLFGLEGHSAGGMLSALFWYRMLRGRGGAASTAAGAAGRSGSATASASPRQVAEPTRAPRWAHAYGDAASSKPVGWPATA